MTSRRWAASFFVALSLSWISLSGFARTCRAQACCAGAGAVTPGRLSLHDDALVGAQLRAAHAFGSFDADARFATKARGTSEHDFEEDLFGSIRLPFAPRAQLAALVPFVQTQRAANGTSDFGGGIGDVNVNARYDFFYAGQSRYVPGIGLLAGVTFPTGRPPDDASPPLAADATGTGAFQGNLGLSIEQTFGPWLVTAYGIVAKRSTRTIHGVETTLGTSWTALAAVAYTFPKDYALALSASFTGEGDAELNGTTVPKSARRQPVVGVVGVAPVTDHLRLQGGLSFTPPIDALGKNELATIALILTAVYAWY